MKLKSLALAATASALWAALPAQAQTEIQWWHSMTGALGDRVNDFANGFNASQKDYKIVPVYKGSYPESMTAAIAAYRAGNAPHIVQVFEVGTATMMSAQGRDQAGVRADEGIGAEVRPEGLCQRGGGLLHRPASGNMLSMPFNSSTPVFYINKDAFKKAGLDPNVAPKTWKEFAVAAGKLKASGQECVYTTGWPSWVHVENFSAWHNLPIGTLENGIGGIDTKFTINSPAHVAQIEMLAGFAKNGWFTYAGRRNEAEAKFFSGECAMLTSSSAAQANIRKNAKFDFSVNFLPYNDSIKGAPQNSIIGGASLWVLGGKKPAEYKGVAQFFNYLSQPELQAQVAPGDRLRADHQRGGRSDQGLGLLREEPGHRRGREAAEQQAADRQFQGPALRQLRAGPHRHRRGDRGGAVRQEERAAGDGRRHRARQRDPAQVRRSQQGQLILSLGTAAGRGTAAAAGDCR